MSLVLSQAEARVIGCLLEKSVTTPDQYPLTLNSLTNACNQKSSRHPVMSMDKGEVLNAIRSLEEKHLVRTEENFKTQIEKYTHRFCNTPFADYQFDEAQYAIVCVLLLRGPRTPGELRANSGRLHDFASNEDVVTALESLRTQANPIVVKLPRQLGRKDSEYMHVFHGPIEASHPSRQDPGSPKSSSAESSHPDPNRQEPSRIAALEARVAQLEQRLDELVRERAS